MSPTVDDEILKYLLKLIEKIPCERLLEPISRSEMIHKLPESSVDKIINCLIDAGFAHYHYDGKKKVIKLTPQFIEFLREYQKK